MDDFFATPPRPPRHHEPQPRYQTPGWLGPPSGVLPGVVEMEVVLARTDVVAICLSGVLAYPTGIAFQLVTMGGPGSEDLDLDPHAFHRRMVRRAQGESEIAPDVLRFGIELPDGRRVTNVADDPFSQMAEASRDEDDDTGFEPKGPVLAERGGGGGGADWQQDMWLWPLPEPGTITLACEWPAAGIPVTRREVDAAPILAAAQRAQVIFEFPDPPDDDDHREFAIIR